MLKNIKLIFIDSNTKFFSMDIFLSYTHDDKQFVHKIAKNLSKNFKVWIDKEKIHVGDSLNKKIEDGIMNCSKFIAFISRKYISSLNCKNEFFYAQNSKKPCMYVVLEKLDSRENNGFNLILNGDAVRLDAFKIFKQDLDEYVHDVEKELEPSLRELNPTLWELNSNPIDKIHKDEFFTGRNNIFTEIDKEPRACFTILCGLPGIGKSSIAREYTYRKLDNKTFKEVYWVDASSAEKIVDSLYAAGNQIDKNKQMTNRADTIKNLFNHIKDSNDVLITFDNLVELHHLKNSINFDLNLMKCSVLVTTRNAVIQREFRNARNIEVSAFNIDESIQYINLKFPEMSDELVKKIVNVLSQQDKILPYKLVVLINSLIEDPTIDIEDLQANNIRTNTYVKTLLDNLSKTSPNTVKLLKYVMLLDPDYIFGKLIEKLHVGADFLNALKPFFVDNIAIVVNRNTYDYGITIHGLIYEDLRLAITYEDNEREELLKNISDSVIELFPETSEVPDKTWTRADNYYRHMQKMNMLNYLNENTLSSANIFYKLSLYKRNVLKQYDDALKFAEISLKPNELSADFKGMMIYNLGECHYDLGNFETAFKYFLEALHIRKSYLNNDHAYLVASLSSVGVSYRAMSNYQEALKYNTEALEMCKRISKNDSIDILASLNNVGACFLALGKYKETLECQMQSLDMSKRLFKYDHPYVFKILDNVGVTLKALGKHEEALKFQTEALDMCKRVYKYDHPDAAILLNNMSITYGALNKPQEELNCLKEALDTYNNIFKNDHPFKATLLNNIGRFHSATCNYEEALKYITEALEMRQRYYLKDHHDIATSLNNIGGCYAAKENYEDALEYHKQALDMQKRLVTDDDLNAAGYLNNVGFCYIGMKKYEDALAYLIKALDIRKTVLENSSPEIATTLHNVSVCYKRKGNHTEALKCQLQELNIYKQNFKEHLSIATLLYDVGSTYGELNNHEEALKYNTEALKMRQKLLKVDHVDVAASLESVSVNHKALGNQDKAVEYLKMAEDMYSRLNTPIITSAACIVM